MRLELKALVKALGLAVIDELAEQMRAAVKRAKELDD